MNTNLLKSMKCPNFDPEVFKEISEIDVTKDPTWPPE